jgi:hypothetical protein
VRMYPRSEFPVEKLPEIIRKNGSVNRRALAMRFGAAGCPNAKPEVAAALIKAGHSLDTAFKLAMLAHYMDDLSMHCVERTCKAIISVTEGRNAMANPTGKCAEELAARMEGRPSRWDTPEFHRAAQAGQDTSTKHYPWRTA